MLNPDIISALQYSELLNRSKALSCDALTIIHADPFKGLLPANDHSTIVRPAELPLVRLPFEWRRS